MFCQEIKNIGNEEGDSTGIGMNNVISRLELYYEESGLVEISSEGGQDKGTEVVIYIPVHDTGRMRAESAALDLCENFLLGERKMYRILLADDEGIMLESLKEDH